MASARAACTAAHDAYEGARAQLPGNPEGASAMTSLAQQCVSAEAAWESQQTQLRAAVMGDLDEGTIARLSIALGNRAQGVPVEYMVVNRSPEQWVALKNALRAVEYNATRGEDTPSAITALISDADAHGEVVAAKSRLVSRLAGVRAAMTN